MVPHMICLVPHLTRAAQVWRIRISLPLILDLADGQKYFLPTRCLAPAGEALRPLYRPRIAINADLRSSAPRPDRKTWRASDLAELDRLLGSP